MLRIFPWLIVLLFHGTTSSGFAVADQNISDANSLMRHVDRLWRSDSSHALMTMQVKTAHYQRTMRLEAWSKGKDKSLIVILAPRKDKGVATLKVGNNIWNYLPKIRRVSKVPASMMSGSWMGSHFTNDDLVKESTFEDDYDSSISFQGERNGRQVVEITSIPKPDAAVVWGKVVTTIDKQTLTPVAAIYYDEDDNKVREMLFDQVKTINGKPIPLRLRLYPLDKPRESTIVVYESLEFDIPLEDRLFSLKNLQKRR